MTLKQVLPLLFLGTFLFAADAIQVKGSDTMVNLVQRLAEDYMHRHPDKSISVSGGGSGVGVAALQNKKTDIADASRLIKEKEIEQCQKNKIDVKEFTLAIDALSIIVNPKNPLKSLTVDQIGKIYRGDVTNWKQVGGADKTITLYGRQPNSGTYDFLREHVLKGEYSQSMIQMNGNSQIVQGVQSDASAIGYVGVAYTEQDGKVNSGIKVLFVAAKDGDKAYNPLNRDSVYAGKYPISRGLNQYVNGTPKGLTKAFIDFELSTYGEDIIRAEGFYPVVGEIAEQNERVLGGR